MEEFINKKDGTKIKRAPTKDICETCDQYIFEEISRDYSGDAGFQKALLDCIHDNKTSYSSVIASIIISNRYGEDRIPILIRRLFDAIETDMNLLQS